MIIDLCLEDSEPFAERQALIDAAQAGDADAKATLGDLFRIGDEFTDQDFEEAIRWYRRAAVQAHAGAQNNLGAMYAHGLGVPQDTAIAAEWYREAAEYGLVTAQSNLGLSYLYCDGVEQDDAEAAAWLSRAALQGHVVATRQLGVLFRFGRGVERNIVAAAQLHVKAAIAGDVVSIGNLASYYKEIEHEALSGSLRAALALAKIFNSGLWVEPNPVVGFAWILWGGRYGRRDDDENARRDQYELFLQCYSDLSQSERDESHTLVERMRLRLEQP